MTTLVTADTLPGGKHWSLLMRRGSRLKLTDVEGGANVGMLFYNPQNLLERYNAPDTLKCQHTFKLTTATASIRIWAASSARSSRTRRLARHRLRQLDEGARWQRKWGETSYQGRATTGSRTATIAFWWRRRSTVWARRDLAANVNWFSKVAVADDGAMSLDAKRRARRAHMSSCASRWTRSSCSTPARIRSIPRQTIRASRALRDLRRRRRRRPTILTASRRPRTARGFENNRIFQRRLLRRRRS